MLRDRRYGVSGKFLGNREKVRIHNLALLSFLRGGSPSIQARVARLLSQVGWIRTGSWLREIRWLVCDEISSAKPVHLLMGTRRLRSKTEQGCSITNQIQSDEGEIVKGSQ
jgi:hypothetical protein